MSIIVEHEKRRYEILEKALDVFMEEGFEDATFQKIADKCNITRTTLYIYFKNKREIFNFSIKQLLESMEHDIIKIKMEKNLSHREKLIKVMIMIIENLKDNRSLLSVILSYLLYTSRDNFDPNDRVRRRTVRMRRILTSMLIEGVRAKEFHQNLNVKEANELLYTSLEAAVFRLVVLRRASVEELKTAMQLAINNFTQAT